MGWYKLIFKQKQPIHVGSAKWGVVNETDIFIPGSTMWGALTNTYLQAKKDEIKKIDEKEYENNLKKIGEYFVKISNFFPSFDGKDVLQPTYRKGEFGYLIPDKKEFLPEDKFRFYFVDTLVQTAIEPITRHAKDESLHEIDYILPKPKQNLEYFKDNLYWVGIIYIDDNKLENFLKGVKNIFIGADVRYGYGELELIECSSLEDNDKDNNKSFWWIDNTDKIKIKANEPSPYFIETKNKLELEGEVLLIPDMDFRGGTPKLIEAKFFASIGSKIKNSIENLELSKGKLLLKK
ncbi:RAMP superfamily CRISPR-associated protein [Persephonella sp. IF05-L8]|uniref:RAMP superfamily CRISPR-associated protein n=1 Tax=Persephonella sp. IF05-L8 TaxID=1158338 RepID=UPI00068C2AD4